MRIAEQIERSFASGATILTANARAARWLQREYGLRQREAGSRTWVTPPIEDWEAWLRRQWQERALGEKDAPLLLTSLQERGVWTRMQREDAAQVVSRASMAALAESAYALLNAYEAHGERKYPWAKADAERFRKWAAEFDRECARRNWIPRAALEGKLASELGHSELPREILLVGFDRLTPAQGRLLRALEERGVSVRTAEMGCAEQDREFIRAAGLREEITACAWRVREWMEQNPEARIGIVVPDMNAVRAEMERVFRRVLMPQADDIFSAQAMPFEFSLGQPLASAPAVRAALLLLRWLTGPLREEEVSWLLLSGYLNGAEYLAAAKQDAKLRESTPISGEITLAGFLGRAGTSRLGAFTKLDDARRAAANRMEDLRLPGPWTELAQLLLGKAGWPGGADRGSIHFQTLRRWERALDEIALLDFDGQRVSYADFLRTLEAHAAETIFSPESRGAPVQVMGALEASGQQFDAAWFLGVDDESWPPLGRAHPLLPNELQRRFGMPYADATNDLELAGAVTARIGESAPEVVFSHAERNKDGELRPSPLLPETAEWVQAREAAPLDDEPETLEELEEPSARIPWPSEKPAGGVDVLKLQAACPFHAFAAKRLGAEPLDRREWGLSAAERGDLLHQVLRKFWEPKDGVPRSLADLTAEISDGPLDAVLDAAIAEVFAAEFGQVDDPWLREYLASERRRLLRRLSEWMRVEAGRVPFTVIACEQKLDDVHVGGLKLRLRADRIDELASGERLLIDYKTGKVSPADWEGPRPNEPQLPLYALFGGVQDVHGVLFARIRVGETSFAGSVEDLHRQLLPEAKETSALGKIVYSKPLRDEWEAALLALAADFMRGEAAVDPKDRIETCRYCPMAGLCRVAEVCDPLEVEAYGDDYESSR
jgi:probable DNA repair protein